MLADVKNPAGLRKINDALRRKQHRIAPDLAWHVVCLTASEGAYMIKITNVLVATDFSDTSASALNYGREFARTFGATLHVLHVVENALMWAGPEAAGIDFVQLQAELAGGARQTLHRIVTTEDRTQLKAVTAVRTGSSPAFEIARYAKAENIDIILLGTHGRGTMGHLLMGNVAEKVVRIAPCPGTDGAPSRTRVHPTGRARGDRHSEALTRAPRCRPYLLPRRVSCCAMARLPASGRQPCPIATPCVGFLTSSRPPRGGFASRGDHGIGRVAGSTV